MKSVPVPTRWPLREALHRRGRPFTDAPELWLLDGAPVPEWRAAGDGPSGEAPVRRRWSAPSRPRPPDPPTTAAVAPAPSPEALAAGPPDSFERDRRERPEPGFAESMRVVLRARHYSGRTEKAYLGWLRRFASHHRGRRLDQMGTEEVAAYLATLATRDHVAASTQNQAFSALVFFYREVLEREIPGLVDVVRAKRPVRVPLVLSPEEVRAVLARARGVPRLMAALMYGAGLRLLECCRLRVKDVDFHRHEITVRD